MGSASSGSSASVVQCSSGLPNGTPHPTTFLEDASLTTPVSQPEGDVAMFIDWENIKYSLLNRENRLPNVQGLKEAAGRFGRVVTAKAYANWQEGQHLRDPNDLYSVGIEPIYVPTIFVGAGDPGLDGLPRRKNSVDIKLAVDVVEFALLNPTVSTFVFVTGDGDFIHLINTLRTRGKRVVIIGASWNTSWQLTSTADQFVAYDIDVDPITPRPTERPALVPLDETFRVLADVVHSVREKRRPNVFAQVKLLLSSRLGSFDEQAYGFSKFKDFMREAERRGLVKMQTVGLTDRVYLPDEEIDTGLPAETPQEVEREAEDAAHAEPEATALEGAAEERVTAILRFVDMLEQSSPFMSFNYIVNRCAEARIVPLTLRELSGLVDRAVQEGMFLTDSRTILDRVTGEYRDINIFRLNRRDPLVARVLESEIAGVAITP
ncbi:MAG: NYN domain-containing protein [Chloroflexi bacterium]|nr:NYN domain-containing protein [Chloroflexota bacterium]